ncbi:MAG TPA: energy transducer TonB [Blastocatellia bacterium]|nr:energy transducer TonB [Blastocatellia bacterium]
MEKQAVQTAQQMLASKLDPDLPRAAFGPWFNQLIGPEASGVWQLTECGERDGEPNVADRDLIACAEVNAILPDGRQVIVAIQVGTFKKGITGEPAFYSAVIGQDDYLYRISRLRDLPARLHHHEKPPILLPVVSLGLPRAQFGVKPIYASSFNPSPYPWTESAPPPAETKPLPAAPEVTQQKTAPQEPQQVQEGVLRGRAIKLAKPVYSSVARNLSILGEVKVQILIAEDGHVIEAKAITGNPVLRMSAVEAAKKSLFQPTLVNGTPVKAAGTLTFVFDTR